MKLERIVDWLDRVLDVKSFSDVSNNGVQIAREGDDVTKVAFGVDASVRTVRAAAAVGAQLLVVHHGISWGGGIQRITDGVYNVVKAAMDANIALYAVHLPLDANHAYGNNYELARYLGLKNLKPAFVYHGETIGVTGTLPNGKKVGVCSGGAGCHAVDAKALGCDLFITGEADWGETIAAENVGMPFVCAGHYQTETFGVKAVAKAMARQLKVATVFIPRDDREAANEKVACHVQGA
jgi:putative NIF3 family GTP cyclohydrolase 1 type 2